MPIQGTAADILKRAMIDVHAALPSLAGGRTRMILTVHDELLFEAPSETAEEAAAALREHHGAGRAAARAADRGRRDRRELEGSEELTRSVRSRTRPAGFERFPLADHAGQRLRVIAHGQTRGAVRQDALHHQPIEIGAERDPAVARQRRRGPMRRWLRSAPARDRQRRAPRRPASSPPALDPASSEISSAMRVAIRAYMSPRSA